MERHIAQHIPISFVLNCKYEKGEGEMAPNFLVGKSLKVARVNILAIVVTVENDSVFTIDDGTGKISVRVFEPIEHFFNPDIGQIVNVIGKPREYNDERYIMPEIIKKSNEKWMRLRKEKLKKINTQNKEETKEIKQETAERITEKVVDKHEEVLKFIKKNDNGEGVEIETIIKNSGIDTAEQVVENMLKEGELFENQPGRIKILE